MGSIESDLDKIYLFSQDGKNVLNRIVYSSNGYSLTRSKHWTYTGINPFHPLSPTWTIKLVPSLMHVFLIPPKDRLDNAAITFDQYHLLFIKTMAYLPMYARIKTEPVSVVIQSWSQSSSSVCFPPFGRTSLFQIQANSNRSRTGSIRACCCRYHTGKHIQIPYRIYKG